MIKYYKVGVRSPSGVLLFLGDNHRLLSHTLKLTWPIVSKELGNDLPGLYNKIGVTQGKIKAFLLRNGIKEAELTVNAPQVVDMNAREYGDKDPDNSFKREVLGRVMQIFLFDLWTVCQHGLSQMETSDNTARIFLRFLSLAQQHARTEREVAFYADKLCITPKYLSQIACTITNLPASQWIQFYAAFELVSLLNDTTKTLTEVSDLMHFENISHFSRYVKKTLGKTPSEYRQK